MRIRSHSPNKLISVRVLSLLTQNASILPVSRAVSSNASTGAFTPKGHSKMHGDEWTTDEISLRLRRIGLLKLVVRLSVHNVAIRFACARQEILDSLISI